MQRLTPFRIFLCSLLLLLSASIGLAQEDDDAQQVAQGVQPFPITNADVVSDYAMPGDDVNVYVDEIAQLADRINTWRVSQGLHPLAHNGVLEGMAASQADWLASQPGFNVAEIHNGRQGEDPRARSQFPEFAWPTFGHPARMSVTEIAGIGSINSAMQFWQGSKLHSDSALSLRYREMGIAIRDLPNSSDKVYIVVFGSRPNVIPAQVDLNERLVYLTREERTDWQGDWMGYPNRLRLFDTTQAPLSDWIQWQRYIDLPTVSGDFFYILFQATDGKTVYTRVDLEPEWTIIEPPTAAAPEEPSLASEVDGAASVFEEFPVSNYLIESAYEFPERINYYPDEIAGTAAEINAWRISQGLWPLAHNGILEGMAAAQADWLVSQPGINVATIHDGRTGESPRARSQFPEFAWPTYGHPERMSVTEIAGIGSIRSSMDFWRSSSIHTQSALSRMYREVGIAVRDIPNSTDKLYIVVLGGRPDVLPALANASEGLLYLSTEQREWEGDWIGFTSRFRLFDEDQSPLSDWQQFQRIVNLPDVEGDIIYVHAQDVAGNDVYTEVPLNPTWTLFPDGAPGAPVESDEPVPADADVVEAEPSTESDVEHTDSEIEAADAEVMDEEVVEITEDVPTDASELAESELVEEDEMVADETLVESELSAAPTPEPTPEPEPEIPTLELIYDENTIAFYNPGSEPINLENVVLAGNGERFSATRFELVSPGLDVHDLPGTQCTQVWPWNAGQTFPAPDGCTMRRAIINVADDDVFWTSGTFDVIQADTPIATCDAAAGFCSVVLPDVP